jgi:hypothetical protein
VTARSTSNGARPVRSVGINDRRLRRSKGRCPPEGAYLAKPYSGVRGETSDERGARRVTELANQQAQLKHEAAERRER